MTPAGPAPLRTTHGVRVRGARAARWAVALLLALLGWGVADREAHAQPAAADTSLRVERVGPSTIRARPGEAFTARMRVENAGDRERAVRTELGLPDGWRTTTSPSARSLSPGESTLRLLRVSVPAGAPAGRNEVQVRVADTSDASVTDTTAVQVQVDSVREARVAVAEAPRSIGAGQSYTAVFSVTNAGNVPLRTRHSAESNRSFPVTVDPPTDTVGPRETKRVRVEVETDAVDEAFEHRLSLSVGLAPGDTTLTDRATTEVIPGGETGGLFSGPQYPTMLRMFAFGSQAAQGGQVELEGSGPLSTADDHTVDLFIRTPGQSGGTRFGRRSRYRLAYTSSAWTVRVGDHTFERTRLAERGRRGMGGEVQYRTGPWAIGGYAFGSRFGQSARQGSAYAQYMAHPRAQLTANVVRNEGAFATGTLGTLQARLVPWAEAEVDLEAGIGDGEEGQDTAYRAALDGDPSWGSYQVRHQQVGSAFPSSFNGVRRTSASLAADLSDRVGVRGSLRRSVRDRAFDQTFEATTARVGGTTRGGGERLRWSLGADALVDRRLLRDEEFLRVQGGLRTTAIGLQPLLEVGQFSPPGGGMEQSCVTEHSPERMRPVAAATSCFNHHSASIYMFTCLPFAGGALVHSRRHAQRWSRTSANRVRRNSRPTALTFRASQLVTPRQPSPLTLLLART
ncbi:MAG: NEW3 domain-containing protein [Salinibacter sp.]